MLIRICIIITLFRWSTAEIGIPKETISVHAVSNRPTATATASKPNICKQSVEETGQVRMETFGGDFATMTTSIYRREELKNWGEGDGDDWVQSNSFGSTSTTSTTSTTSDLSDGEFGFLSLLIFAPIILALVGMVVIAIILALVELILMCLECCFGSKDEHIHGENNRQTSEVRRADNVLPQPPPAYLRSDEETLV
ncbi:hypothetical protein KGF57_004510 [Candida theae]|uniref:Uncharacterized protein n=1 Tax=Candida theae TaxID=1198502 RepID=A0AAD5BB20_9ASCO|nr:uncharacterized protein KGF57_004510 [Candida theae]KAI5950000.1 hypothetical protein KGF57_004510 [Candida theae]